MKRNKRPNENKALENPAAEGSMLSFDASSIDAPSYDAPLTDESPNDDSPSDEALKESAGEKMTEEQSKERAFGADSESPDAVFTSQEAESAGKTENRKRDENLALLQQLKPDDIKGEDRETNTEKRGARMVRSLLLSAFLLVFLSSACYVIYRIANTKMANALYSNLTHNFYNISTSEESYVPHLKSDEEALPERTLFDQSENPDLRMEQSDKGSRFKQMLPNLQELQRINRNSVGWIKIEGTRIDYPVVRGNNNEYYLSHAFDNSVSVAGSVFLDFNNDKSLKKNRNSVIYAHNMTDGTMFKTLLNFKDANMFKNGKIEIYTTEGILIYTPFSAYVAEPEYPFFRTEFTDDKDFAAFLDEIKGNSWIPSNIKPKAEDKIITLMTCTNTVINKRYVVHAVLTGTEE